MRFASSPSTKTSSTLTDSSLATQFGETYSIAAKAGYYQMCEWLMTMWQEHGPREVVFMPPQGSKEEEDAPST